MAASVLGQGSILPGLGTSGSFNPKELRHAELKPALVVLVMEMVPIWTPQQLLRATRSVHRFGHNPFSLHHRGCCCFAVLLRAAGAVGLG